ncbi:MAG: nucleotidyltransferase domain-containing protein [Muribaculaceae bacterium]|nr:nucleotidyltransferase domain-containing protein [Muribaculaceae bacterium]
MEGAVPQVGSTDGTDGTNAVSQEASNGTDGTNDEVAVETVMATQPAPLSEEEADDLILLSANRAQEMPVVGFTPENWAAEFPDGKVNTPLGEVKMGDNQFQKLGDKGRQDQLGMIKPTLENPDVIIEDASEAKDGDVAERKSSYVFVKAFKKADGSRYYYFTSVTVSKEGKEVVISNQEKRKNAIANLLTNGKLVWKHADDVSAASDVEQGLYSSQGKMSDPTTEGTDAPQTNDVQNGKLLYRFDGGAQTEQTPASVSVTTSRTNPGVSDGKGSENSATVQENGEKKAENQTPIQGLDGYTEDEVLSLVRGDIEEKLADAGIDGVTIKGMALHGSRLRGDAREDSDLDVVVEYEGDMSEDGLFNILNDEPMEIEGVRVDVNPITSGKSGTLDQYMERSRQFDALKRRTAQGIHIRSYKNRIAR